MSRLIRIIFIGLAICGTVVGARSWAHGGPNAVLFVAPYGVDRGDCQDSAEPCRSIAYALTQIGKGGQIRVAEGTYEIETPEEIFFLVSDAVDIEGGHRFKLSFRQRELKMSFLTGVPSRYRDALSQRGFHIIADRKGTEQLEASEIDKLLALHEQLKSSAPATPCAGGTAAGLPCDSVDLLSHLALEDFSSRPSSAADVWGFVDLNTNREYVFVGVQNGTAVIDVTDPETPVEVGLIGGQNTSWRDIKVYQSYDDADSRWKAYAYVTADSASDGLVVIDLTGLPHRISKLAYTSDFSSAHNVYTSNTDYSTGIALTNSVPTLIIAGPNRNVGQYRAYSLANAAAPLLITGTTATQYMHDASSLMITDVRKDNQCAVAGPYCQVLLDFNENSIDIWNITEPNRPNLLSSTTYVNSNNTYVHSGWWSEDKQYMFVHDELDERDFGLQTTLRVFSLTDLMSPTLGATWTGPTRAIDHNGFVRGNRYYMSNYTRGLTVLDISDPGAPTQAGFLDTFPGDSTSFNGAWGVYPFFFSDTIAISDINSGLYLARDQSRDVAQGSFSFAQSSFGIVEGQQAQIAVHRLGGASNNVSVDYEVLGATAETVDYQINSGLLVWTAGDASDKSITLTATADGVVEGLERIIVRLINPGGGATVGAGHTASVYLSDPGAASEIHFMETSINTGEGGFGTAVIVLQRTGSALGAATVDYSVSGGDATVGTDYQGSTSGTVSWANGDADSKSLMFSIEDDGVGEYTEFFEITLSNSSGASISGSPTVVVNIASTPVAGNPPPRSVPSRSGGGATGPLWIILLAFLAILRGFNRRDDV